MFVPDCIVTGGSGLFGTCAANIDVSADAKLYPTELRASTLNLYVAPGVSRTEV